MLHTQAPFDLKTGPVFRANLYEADSGTYILLLWHHICIDLWAVVLLFDEWRHLYPACCAAKGPPKTMPPALPSMPPTMDACIRQQVQPPEA